MTTTFQDARRRGQALVELAIAMFLLMLLLAAIVSIGFLLHGANVLQQAADVGAQELARLPLPPVMEFPPLGAGAAATARHTSTNPAFAPDEQQPPNLFAQSAVRAQIFDERWLVIDLDAPEAEDLDDLFAQAPLINRLLRPLMIVDRIGGGRLLRYPGALVRNTSTGELTVLIPLVVERTGLGATGVPPDPEMLRLEWRAVVEEIRTPDQSSTDAHHGPFNLLPPADAALPAGFQPGFVALRLNYPYQSSALVAHQYRRADGTISGVIPLGEAGVESLPVGADDAGVIDGAEPPAPYELVVAANDELGAHAGAYGLGRLAAYGGYVRPFRRVLSAQGIYRREVFE